MNIKEENPSHFVNEQETDGGDVQQQEEQECGDDGHPNAGLWNVGEQLDEAKAEQPSFFHVGGLYSVLGKFQHSVRMDEHIGVVEQQDQ